MSKAKLAENDTTLKFTNKIEKTLYRLRKGKKFTDKECLQYIRQILYHHDCMIW